MIIQVCMFTNACRCLQINRRNDPWIILFSPPHLFSFFFLFCMLNYRLHKRCINQGWVWKESAVWLAGKFVYTELFFIQKQRKRSGKRICQIVDQLFHTRNLHLQTTEPCHQLCPAPTMHHIHLALTQRSDKVQYMTSESLEQCMLSCFHMPT